MADPQGWNAYAYALNNPLVLIDKGGAEAGYYYDYGGAMYSPYDKEYPTSAHPIRDTLLLGAAVGTALLAPEALPAMGAIGRSLLGLGMAAAPQAQRGVELAADVLAPPGTPSFSTAAFGFAKVEGVFEGYTVGRLASGAEVAANFTKSGENVTASILAAFNPQGVKGAGTLNSILQGAQAVAKGQGATTLTIQAVGVTNQRLADILVKEGFKETTIKVGKETVKALVKTIKLP